MRCHDPSTFVGTDLSHFRLAQEMVGNVENKVVTAARWIERVDAEFGRWQDFFHFATRELWKRLLPQRDCFDLPMDDLSKHIERTPSSRYEAPESRLSEVEVKDIMKDLDRLDDLLEQKREREGKSLNDLLEDLFDIHSCDLNYWIVGLPLELSVAGFVDAAVTIACRCSYLDPGNMLGDFGQIIGDCDGRSVKACNWELRKRNKDG